MVTADLHLPEGILDILKAIFDTLTFFAFVLLIIALFYAKNKYPLFKKKSFWPMLGFAVLGMISTAMDALDEFFWFSPQEFYNGFWKPTRLILFLVGVILLLYTFYEFYRFSYRLFGYAEDEKLDD